MFRSVMLLHEIWNIMFEGLFFEVELFSYVKITCPVFLHFNYIAMLCLHFKCASIQTFQRPSIRTMDLIDEILLRFQIYSFSRKA